MLSGVTMLGGRSFSVVNWDAVTVLNEHYVMKLMRSTGLDATMPIETESDEAYMMRMHAKMVDTLQLPELLAGYLLPIGKAEGDFTLALATETASFIKGLTAPADKATVHELGLAVTFDFFRAGLASLRHSRNVLQSLADQAATKNAEASPAAH